MKDPGGSNHEVEQRFTDPVIPGDGRCQVERVAKQTPVVETVDARNHRGRGGRKSVRTGWSRAGKRHLGRTAARQTIGQMAINRLNGTARDELVEMGNH
jgi:hypothetical protein